MRDYFKEFLLNKNPMSSFFGQTASDASAAVPQTSTMTTLASLKPHIIWSLVTITVAFLAWKAGKWYSGYELMKQASTPTVSIAKVQS